MNAVTPPDLERRAGLQLLTEDEAAELLGISARTLRDLRRQGQIRYVAITARTIRYRPEDCDEYIAAHVRVETPSPKRGGKTPRVNRGAPGSNVVRFTQRKR